MESRYFTIKEEIYNTSPRTVLFCNSNESSGIWLEQPREMFTSTYKLIDNKLHVSHCGQEECCPYQLIDIEDVTEITKQQYNKLKNGKQ